MDADHSRITALHGRLAGRTVFILGNGPSVKEHPLERLRGLPIIGMNASPLLDREFGFACGYYVVSDARFLTHPDKRAFATLEYLKKDVVRVLREELRDVDVRELRNSTHYVRALGKNGYSHDLARGFYFGCSTSLLAIQLASYLGCTTIVLLGNDFRYPRNQPRFYHEARPQAQDPFLSIQIWNVRNAYNLLQEKGVDLWLCTRNSNLVPYVPWRSFDDLVAKARDEVVKPS